VIQTASPAGKRTPGLAFHQTADGSYQISDVKSGATLTAIGEDVNPVRVVVRRGRIRRAKMALEKTDPAKLTM